MMISAFSSSLRRRAAQDAPPATPPTMIDFHDLSFVEAELLSKSGNRSNVHFAFVAGFGACSIESASASV